MLIQVEEIMRMKRFLTGLYVKHNSIGKTYEEFVPDMERDNFMTAEESLAYGLIDKIIEKREA
jgi:ATP-dependent Clp protease protease subunit